MTSYYVATRQLFNQYKKTEKDEELKNLQNDTLYIADDCLVSYKDQQSKIMQPLYSACIKDKKEIMAGYFFKYKFVSSGVLNKMIFNDATPIYYLITNLDYRDIVIVNIINSKTGSIIYDSKASYKTGIIAKDMDKLNKAIISSK